MGVGFQINRPGRYSRSRFSGQADEGPLTEVVVWADIEPDERAGSPLQSCRWLMDALTRAIRDEVGTLLGLRVPEEEMLAVMAADAFLRLPQVTALSGLSTAQLYRLMSDGSFPRPVVLGPNARAWRLSEIKAWQAARIAARDTGADADMRAVNPNIGRGRRPKRAGQHA